MPSADRGSASPWLAGQEQPADGESEHTLVATHADQGQTNTLPPTKQWHGPRCRYDTPPPCPPAAAAPPNSVIDNS
jgi:hypothetical protein